MHLSMSLPPDNAIPSSAADLRAEAQRIQDSGILGAGGRLPELFGFLLSCSLEGRSPKEAEIALSVFSRPGADAGRDDPVARVYVHRLRKKIDEFYLRHGAERGVRIDIPKGDYRLVCTPVPPASAPSASLPGSVNTGRRYSRRVLIGAGLGLFGAGYLTASTLLASGSQQTDAVSQTRIWRALAAGERPLSVVVGDYYMFGEYENQHALRRLIRDFSINSKEDLIRKQSREENGFERFSDVALQYLPASAAYALTDLAPLLRDSGEVRVALASALDAERLKSDDILYVGLLSGLGPLRDPVFSRSRFRFGASYDQLIDQQTGQSYVSEAFLGAPDDQIYRDYGFFATFEGPAGNRIAILSGARDTAVMGLAAAMTQADQLRRLEQTAGAESDFEALFEVRGQSHVDLEARLISLYPVDSSAIWSGGRARTAFRPPQ